MSALLSPEATIAAIATAPGRGAVAIVRVSGPATQAIAARVFCSREPLMDRRASLGRIVDADGRTLDQGLALMFEAPRSYTGDDLLELHVHGSPVVAGLVLDAVVQAGARLATEGEFTRRAFLAGKLDLSAAEAVADLIAAEHRSAARAAAAQLGGGLASEVQRLDRELANTLEELAAAIDFPDEVVSPEPALFEARLAAVATALQELLARSEVGQLIREGVVVPIVGPPNVGKSSLLNALLGVDRALVSPTAGTTRDTIEETIVLAGVPIRLVDTAGLRETNDPLEAAGMARTLAALESARLVIVVLDGSRPLDEATETVMAQTRSMNRIIFFNKADLGTTGFTSRSSFEDEALSGSAFAPASIDALTAVLGQRLRNDARPDLERPHLANARQRDAVTEAVKALALARATIAARHPIDLAAGDITAARAALGFLNGTQVTESLLDGIFARFCIGK